MLKQAVLGECAPFIFNHGKDGEIWNSSQFLSNIPVDMHIGEDNQIKASLSISKKLNEPLRMVLLSLRRKENPFVVIITIRSFHTRLLMYCFYRIYFL